MTQFRPMSEEEILKILNNMKKTTCDVDPCNMNFLYGIQRCPTRNMDKDNKQIAIKWTLPPVLEKSPS